VTDDITLYVPHRGAMCWLDRVLDAGPEHLQAEAVLRADHLMVRDGALSGATGIEFMAQAVAAWAGWQRAGGEPRIGFLLGTRRYQCSRAQFRVGETLRIEVHKLFQADNGLGQFDARIEIAGVEVASANLNVFGPDDPQAFLNGTAPA
jgi:predicted hotdog family 3-hydroxylacyl-ACP dehydratase